MNLRWLATSGVLFVLGCARSSSPMVDAHVEADASRIVGEDAGPAGDASPGMDASVPPTSCRDGWHCDDGERCTGVETCAPGHPRADEHGCVTGTPPCGADRCIEEPYECVVGCAGGGDLDGDGHAASACGGDDCDDSRADVHPGAEEDCDLADQDCDARIDEDLGPARYPDRDGDGYGDAWFVGAGCPESDWVTNDDDCDDRDPDRHPGATEICDFVDDDCDGDLGSELDVDGDGETSFACGGLDCDDHDPDVGPHRGEICFDGIDNNCDGSDWEDADGDGVISGFCGGADCDDYDPTIGEIDLDGDGAGCGMDCDDSNPLVFDGAAELCDGIDNACDGGREDVDGDGFIASGFACDATGPGSRPPTDCRDDDWIVRPQPTDACDGIDTDCDPTTPDDSAACLPGHTCVGGACRQTVQIAAGGGTTCARLEDGSVRCFGGHFDDASNGSWMPVAISGIRAVDIDIGRYACAATVDGTAWCWGTGWRGAVAAPPDVVGVEAGDGAPCTLHRSGAVYCEGMEIPALHGAIQVERYLHSCAIVRGEVWCWGPNEFGQLGNGTIVAHYAPVRAEGIDDAVEIAVGRLSTCALRESGSIACWGSNPGGALGTADASDRVLRPSTVSMPAASSIAWGAGAYCAVTSVGVRCWHSARLGVATPAPDILGAIRVVVGQRHGCALMGDRSVQCWGTGLGRGRPSWSSGGMAPMPAASL